jgi:hypothetical protein
MKKTTRKATKAKATVKRPKTTAKAPKGIRAQASRRTAEGKFTKIILRMPPLRINDVEGARCLHGEARERGCPRTIRKAPGFGPVNRFNPGKVMATPGAFAAFEASGESLFDYLARHLSGDWGEVDAEDARENELSLKHDLRVLSAYTLKNGTKIWVITETDRSSTCLLLPEEY